MRAYNRGMARGTAFIAALIAGALIAAPAHPPMGHAANDAVEVAAVVLDAAAMTQATGTDFSKTYTVIEVTVTPKGKTYDVQPDDFLLRIPSDADSSGPMAASQVLGAGGGLVLHREPEHIGINGGNVATVGLSAGANKASVPAADVSALQKRMLPAKNTSDPVTGLLFFPFAKKKPGNLDLVFTTPGGKLHIEFK